MFAAERCRREEDHKSEQHLALINNQIKTLKLAAATSTAATSKAAASAAAASATAASATAATTATAPGHLLHTALAALLVEEVEGREAHIGDFFFAKYETLIGNCIDGFRDVFGRQRGCGCAPRKRKAQTSGTQSRYGGGFGDALPLRSLFHP
jgi:hypothetical protein